MINLLFISGGEIVVLGLVVLLLFGAKSIPDVARMLGKGMNEFRRASDEIKRELRDQTGDVKSDLDDMRNYINEESKGIKNSINSDISDDDPYDLKNQESPQKDMLSESNPNKEGTAKQTKKEDTESDGPISRGTNIEE